MAPSPRGHFLSLPFEIREMIYKNVLITGSPKFPCWRLSRGTNFSTDNKDYECRNTYPTRNFSALLYVNRQIYAEAKPIMLANNTLSIGLECEKFQDSLLDSFTSDIGPEKASLLRHIEMFPPFPANNKEGQQLSLTSDDLRACHVLASRCPRLTTVTSRTGVTRAISSAIIIRTGIVLVCGRFWWKLTVLRRSPSIKEIAMITYNYAVDPTLEAILDDLGWVALSVLYALNPIIAQSNVTRPLYKNTPT